MQPSSKNITKLLNIYNIKQNHVSRSRKQEMPIFEDDYRCCMNKQDRSDIQDTIVQHYNYVTIDMAEKQFRTKYSGQLCENT